MNKKKILHLMSNEKITPQLIENFNQLYVDNLFLILDDHNLILKNSELKYNVTEFDINSFVQKYSVTAIIIHGLAALFAKFICDLNIQLKTAWFVWGFDIYNGPKYRKHLYATETTKYLGLMAKLKWSPICRNLYFKLNKNVDFNALKESSYNRIDYFCSYIDEDYIFFDKHYDHNTTFFYSPFNTLEQYLGGNEKIRLKNNAQDIIVGNSNAIENNHLDVLKLLKDKYSVHNTNIVLPLSYGGNSKYLAELSKKGNDYFDTYFRPLLNFISKDKYLELLTNCSTAIFYQYRQQAMGNIIALLFMGTRIYLSTKNPVYTFCKRVGLHIFDLDNDFNIYRNTILEEKKANENRKILYSIFNTKEVLNKLNTLIDIL